jgi:hypothetical protein
MIAIDIPRKRIHISKFLDSFDAEVVYERLYRLLHSGACRSIPMPGNWPVWLKGTYRPDGYRQRMSLVSVNGWTIESRHVAQ